jgi:glycosyltransferase involved in cell wall biosynthesis
MVHDLLARLGDAPSAASVDVLEGGWSELRSAASRSSCEVLCFAPFGLEPVETGWLGRLRAALGEGNVAATPTLVRPARGLRRATEHDGLVASAGFDTDLDDAGAPVVTARCAGAPIQPRSEMAEVPAAPLHGLMVDRAAYVAAGGLAGAGDDLGAAAVDLCQRLRAQGGRIVHVADALAADARPVPSRRSLRHPVDPTSAAWREVVDRWGPKLVHDARGGGALPLRLAISTAVTSRQVSRRWGDWHLADGLRRALERRGVEVLLGTHADASSPTARSRDVHLVVRGLSPVDRTPGQRHVLWVISHPSEVTTAECDEADLVLVASPVFAEELRARTSTPVEVFLQATDPHRFSPGPSGSRHRHDITVVAKSRDVRRQIVADAIDAGLEPAIHGSGWEGLVDRRLVCSDYVDNAFLPHVYRGAGVVLNDHWDEMRRGGFVSNRLYDVLACGTPVISDEVAGIPELFDDAVPMYRTRDELVSLVRSALDEPDRARERAERGRAAVLRRHTFDHRAEQLLGLLHEHQLDDRGRIALAT